MAKTEARRRANRAPMGELLGELTRLEVEKRQISQQLQNIPLETQLLSLADISIERETEGLREILGILKKL